MTYRSTSPMGLSDYLSRQILDLIRQEGMSSGERLPSVKALAERFSVATPTLREALRSLQANGIVEIRHGSGVYVCDAQERILLTNPYISQIETSTVLQLLDARILIEPYLSELAARNVQSIGEERLLELEGVLDEASYYLSKNDEILHQMNMKFHRTVADFSGNAVLAQVIGSLVEIYSYEQLAVISFYDNRLRDNQEHRSIFAAIRKGEAESAREQMSQHLMDVRSVVESRFTEAELLDSKGVPSEQLQHGQS